MANTARKIMPVEPTDRIVVNKKAELPPFRDGTGVAKRVNAVIACNGKPVESALKRGARTSTVRFLAKAKVITLKHAATK